MEQLCKKKLKAMLLEFEKEGRNNRIHWFKVIEESHVLCKKKTKAMLLEFEKEGRNHRIHWFKVMAKLWKKVMFLSFVGTPY